MSDVDLATPRPWKVSDHPPLGDLWWVDEAIEGDGRVICHVVNQSSDGDAALIVEAVNRFDALMAVAEAARQYVAHFAYPEPGIDPRLDAVAAALAELDRIP